MPVANFSRVNLQYSYGMTLLADVFLSAILLVPNFFETVIGTRGVRPLERLKRKQVVIHQLPLVAEKSESWRQSARRVRRRRRKAEVSTERTRRGDPLCFPRRRCLSTREDAKGWSPLRLVTQLTTHTHPFRSPCKGKDGGGPSGFEQTR